MKTVTLPGSAWNRIVDVVQAHGTPTDIALLREQLDGTVKVKVTRNGVTFTARRGHDLRNTVNVSAS